MKYATARAFRQALEERIRQDYQGKHLSRIRKMIAFERLMARLDSNIQANTLQNAIVLVFESRGDQVPNSFHSFPTTWQQRFNRLAKETQLNFLDFQDATQAAAAFITPVISEQVVGLTWDPIDWWWR